MMECKIVTLKRMTIGQNENCCEKEEDIMKEYKTVAVRDCKMKKCKKLWQ